ncbi:PTS-dependent dihydroxyacetone kinase phosphotransferase subunit DhaM [Viridibacillus sp. YIM B01967]|uniref:phosphoenolpyruvate--glycerone phosphotransferase n=2 Tax=Viridibacillus soli TaxID=2798301 RepID=A0ABS1H7J3_9BACL|nr:PTS-dependent dihydroxyacetone kinase phosphotransferase subunit DhaM [Viridibacillus soli]
MVSHSKDIVKGINDLIQQVAPNVSITYAGGTVNGDIGTSFETVQQAIEENTCHQLFAFYDLGSAKMNLEMAAELSEKEIEILDVSFIEGVYCTAALFEMNADLTVVISELEQLMVK